jgi:hypothetical protein
MTTMATKKTTKPAKPAAAKKTPKAKAAASSKPPRAGRKSAQAQVFDELGQVPAEVPEAEPTSTGETSEGALPTGEEVATFYDEEVKPEEISPVEGSDDDNDDNDDNDDSDDEPEEVHSHEKRTRYLKCELTIADREEKRDRREDIDQQVEDLEGKIATAESEVKALKKRRDGLESEGRALSKCIRDGYENRNVPCEERSAPNEHGTPGVATVRLDTLERIEWRELTAAERQGRLFS